MGVRKTTDFLEKSTWSLAIVLLVLSLFSIFVIPRNQNFEGNIESQELRDIQENAQQQAPEPIENFQAPPPQEK